MVPARSLQQLCRAAFSLCNAASTSALAAPPAMQLGAGALLWAASAGGGGGHHAAAAAGGLRQLARVSAGASAVQGACCASCRAAAWPPPSAAALTSTSLIRLPARCVLPWPPPPQHFHASLDLPAAAEGASPAMNPLQQAPTPAGGGAAAAAGASPLGPAPVSLAGGEVSTLARAIARGISISPRKLNDFAKVVRGLPIQDALIQVGRGCACCACARLPACVGGERCGVGAPPAVG